MSNSEPLPEIDLSSEAPGGGIAATMLSRLAAGGPAELFHYTDAAGLMGIVKTATIWGTDTRFLNDRTEFVHGRDICRRILRKQSGQKAFTALCRRIAEHLSGDEFLFFSASLCEEDDLVPQ